MLNTIAPFFIIDDLDSTIEFYRSKLGFEVLYKGGSDGTDVNTDDPDALYAEFVEP